MSAFQLPYPAAVFAEFPNATPSESPAFAPIWKLATEPATVIVAVPEDRLAAPDRSMLKPEAESL